MIFVDDSYEEIYIVWHCDYPRELINKATIQNNKIIAVESIRLLHYTGTINVTWYSEKTREQIESIVTRIQVPFISEVIIPIPLEQLLTHHLEWVRQFVGGYLEKNRA